MMTLNLICGEDIFSLKCPDTQSAVGCQKAIIKHPWPTIACSFNKVPVIIGSSWSLSIAGHEFSLLNITTFIIFHEIGLTSPAHVDYSLPMLIVQRQKLLCHLMNRKKFKSLLVVLDTVCVQVTLQSVVCLHNRSNEK